MRRTQPSRFAVLELVAMLGLTAVSAQPLATKLTPETDAGTWSKEAKYNATVVGSMAFITAWGVANWNYGGRSPHAKNERWFSRNTKEGGADKLGHFHLSYVLGNALPTLYEHWGFDHETAAWRGMWSSLLIMDYMELGDAFSDYGFSHEDFIMNTLGATTAYWLNRNHYWDERLAFRVEYIPRSTQVDFFTDYEHTKYLAALRLDTLVGGETSYWRYFDLQLGYFARGYEQDDDPRREWFIGVGLNLREVANQLGFNNVGRALHYWQPPGISLRYGENLGD